MSSTASSRTFASASRCWSSRAASPFHPAKLLFKDDFTRPRQLACRSRKARPHQLPRMACSTSTCPRASRCGSSRASKVRWSSSSKPPRWPKAGPTTRSAISTSSGWLTTPDGRQPVFAHARSGTFADYNDLLTYYVGLGGNRNTTTRFRRYIGDPVLRPLLPEHDLSAASGDAGAEPQANHHARRRWITTSNTGATARRCSSSTMPAPYASGWFALRTTYSHLRISPPAHPPASASYFCVE